jgi:hypothetical protein
LFTAKPHLLHPLKLVRRHEHDLRQSGRFGQASVARGHMARAARNGLRPRS